MTIASDFLLLGLNQGASIPEIKKAYRLKAKEFHPDVNKQADASEKFRAITEAYHRIIDFKEGRYSYSQPSIDYEAILRARAQEHAKMRYREWKKKLDEEEKNTSIHDIYWGKNISLAILFITIILITDQLIPPRIKVERIKKSVVAVDDKLYYELQTDSRKIEIESDIAIDGIQTNDLIMVGETPLFHSMKNVTTIQNKKLSPENIVGNYTLALIVNLILLYLIFNFPLKTYKQRLWIKTLLIISSLYYLVSFLQAQR